MSVQKKNRVKFNVGGKIFETTASTLAIAGRESYFGALFDENWDLQTNPAGEHFIDRNPDYFLILLHLLRTGELYIPPNVPEKLLYREAMFYGLMNHVRSAKWGQFDGNRLRSSKSVTVQLTSQGEQLHRTAIRASSDDGCCVAQGSMVHIYDWMLEEHPPINLDYQRINDVDWVGPVDPTGLVISTSGCLDRGLGGIGLFTSTTGELRYKFNVTHEGVAKSYTAGALCFNDSYKLFSSCKCRSNENGIGVWDQTTGQQVDFYYEPPWWSLGDVDRIQWLHNSNCLLVGNFFRRKQNSNISLLDFRSKSVVWTWSEMGVSAYSDQRQFGDAIANEENNSIFVVNEFEKLGFLDLRRDSRSIRWISQLGGMSRWIYPKLALHDGRLFSSMSDGISVFSGSDWVLTSRLRKSLGSSISSICDFSIGGDRLFAFDLEKNVFDIWETLLPPSKQVSKLHCSTNFS